MMRDSQPKILSNEDIAKFSQHLVDAVAKIRAHSDNILNKQFLLPNQGPNTS